MQYLLINDSSLIVLIRLKLFELFSANFKNNLQATFLLLLIRVKLKITSDLNWHIKVPAFWWSRVQIMSSAGISQSYTLYIQT